MLAFWLFAQTTLNIAPAMAADLEIATSVMNIAVSITALFSGIFIVVIGGLADLDSPLSSAASWQRTWDGVGFSVHQRPRFAKPCRPGRPVVGVVSK